MRQPLLIVIYFLLNEIHFAVSFSTFISDILLSYHKTTMISEISCNYIDSFYLIKEVSKQRKSIRIIKFNEKLQEYNALQNNQIFILNLDCNNFTTVLNQASEKNLFSLPYKWILFHKESFSANQDYLSTLNIFVNSDVSVLELHKNETATLRKMYRLKQNLQVELVGYWNKDDGFTDLKIEKNIARRRSDLKRITLNSCLVITNNDSLNHLTDKRDKHIDSIAKVNYVLVEHLSDIVNARINYTVQPTWGYKANNSKWNGMIGLLASKEVDIGGTPLFFTEDRVTVIDYIAMTTPTKSYFIFREPKLSYVTNVFTLPFDKYVWISIIALIIITGLSLYYILNWEVKKHKYFPKKLLKEETGRQYTIIDVALVSFGALCQQATDSVPTSVPGKITTFMLFLSLMFFYTSYSANIVALLQSSSSSIKTLQDLLKSRLEVAVDNTVFNRFYFPNSKEPIRQQLYRQKVAPPGQKPHFIPIVDGVKKIREGLFAFHMETGPGYKIIGELFHESEKCGLQEIQFLEVTDPWLAIQRNSPYKKLLKIGLRKIQESGIQNREVLLIYTKKPECVSRGSSFISVGIVDCYPAAVVLAVGIIASFFIWLMEIIASERFESCKRFKTNKHINNLLEGNVAK